MWQSVVVCGTTGPLVDHLVTTSRPLLQPMKISAVLHASLMPLFWRRMMVFVSDDGCYLSPKMQQTFGRGALQSCPTQSCQEVFVCWDIKFKYTNTQIHFRVVQLLFLSWSITLLALGTPQPGRLPCSVFCLLMLTTQFTSSCRDCHSR